MRRAEGGAKIVGVFRVKNHDFTLKNHIFSNFMGARAGCAPWIHPWIARHSKNTIHEKYKLLQWTIVFIGYPVYTLSFSCSQRHDNRSFLRSRRLTLSLVKVIIEARWISTFTFDIMLPYLYLCNSLYGNTTNNIFLFFFFISMHYSTFFQ